MTSEEKLKQIEARWDSVKGFFRLYSEGDLTDHDWLIARVKDLTEALIESEEILRLEGAVSTADKIVIILTGSKP